MATKYGGYMGKILQIDLTTETAREYPFTDSSAEIPWVEKCSPTTFSPMN